MRRAALPGLVLLLATKAAPLEVLPAILQVASKVMGMQVRPMPAYKVGRKAVLAMALVG